MDFLGCVKDDIYPYKGIERKRKTVRAVIVDNIKKEIGLLHVVCKDQFGNRNHYETPGGGVELNEKLIDTLKREINEEFGYSIKNIKEIGHIDIQYNLLKRIDEGYFYYCEIDCFIGSHLTPEEIGIFKEIVWIKIEDIDEFYLNTKVENVGIMIHKRDYLVINKAKELGYFD